jgi:uncharacterized membrane protein
MIVPAPATRSARGRARAAARSSSGRDRTAAARLAVSAGAGVAAAAAMVALGPWWLAPLAGWDAAGLVYLVWMGRWLWSMGPTQTAAHARREDPGRGARDTLLLAASGASVLAVGLVLVRASKTTGLEKGLLLGTSVLSIVISWSVVHTVYALRYARLYYEGEPGGVSFNEHDPPSFTDFVYLALTIGMTFQVSDTDLQAKPIRRTAVAHALLSYVFGALIVATTVNLIAGLSK